MIFFFLIHLLTFPPHLFIFTFLKKKIFFWPYHEACGLSVPGPGIELRPVAVPNSNYSEVRNLPRAMIFKTFKRMAVQENKRMTEASSLGPSGAQHFRVSRCLPGGMGSKTLPRSCFPEDG